MLKIAMAKGITSNPWFICSDAGVPPSFRLFCLPYAGGNASLFNSWSVSLPRRVQVCGVELPGRRRRFAQPPYKNLQELTNDLSQALKAHVDLPYAIFGISFGALLGFELAHSMLQLGQRPSHLFVANCRAPHLPDLDAPIHALPEPELLSSLQSLGGTPREIVQHPELMELLLPTLRADFKLAETYKYLPKEPFDFPITALWGSEDPGLTSEQLSPWQEHTRGRYELKVLSGDHYLLETARDALLEAISTELNGYLTSRPPRV
jgi:medium-chain acyl-[acyl-carrier-protein] hydrolase